MLHKVYIKNGPKLKNSRPFYLYYKSIYFICKLKVLPGRRTIWFTSTLAGCSIANAMVLAIASAGIAD
jgi:hypothetical protein